MEKLIDTDGRLLCTFVVGFSVANGFKEKSRVTYGYFNEIDRVVFANGMSAAMRMFYKRPEIRVYNGENLIFSCY